MSLCEPQARLDAAELVRLREQLEHLLSFRRADDEVICSMADERDALRAENARLVAMRERTERAATAFARPIAGNYLAKFLANAPPETIAQWILTGTPGDAESE